MKMSGNKKNIYSQVICIAVVLAMMLCACNNASQQPDASQEQAAGEAGAADNDADEAPLVTEEDYRGAIAAAEDDAKKLELYKEFSSGYKMNENEYVEYATLCGKAGDTIAQREVLFMLYRIDPTEAHGQLLSDMTLNITSSDDEKAGELLKSIAEELKKCEGEDFSPQGIKSIVSSDDWKKSFYIDNGTFTSNTKYSSDAVNAEVSSDTLSTRAVITEGDMRYLCEINFDGANVGSVEVKDEKSEGKYFYRQFDAEEVDIMTVNGYIKDGHYVNQLDITIAGIVYQGMFDDAGKTKEEQPEGLEGVAYAFTEDRSNYLYVEDADAATWVADVAKMGFGEF